MILPVKSTALNCKLGSEFLGGRRHKALLLVIAVQTHSQQFNTYDPSEGSPRPLPPSIPGAFPVPGDRPRPSFR
ncbi:unnamed protein product [Bemisia tabaci]|uniref:Uncharacterized protein n=1 Tax=Bemisia tabaci TaxID=7038 RepID=A0A9P0F5U7_BEMTA|nr:unnamed protein product [Bemisia tabaci]